MAVQGLSSDQICHLGQLLVDQPDNAGLRRAPTTTATIEPNNRQRPNEYPRPEPGPLHAFRL